MTNGTDSNAIILVAMTMKQARAAVPALRHVGRKIHDRDDTGRSLIELSRQIEGQIGNYGSSIGIGHEGLERHG